MTDNQKKEIQVLAGQYSKQFDSQKKAVASLRGISEATFIQVMKGNWEEISPEMWRNLGKQIGWKQRRSVLVETMDFQTLILYFITAKEEGVTFSIVGKSGCGKSYAGHFYSEANKGNNVYYLECADYWNRKMFLTKLLEKMGKPNTGYNVGEMMDLIIDTLRRQHQPLIILDEADKLKEEMLYFFITLYNELNGLCGIVWTSTDHIEKRITKGMRNNRKGYKEIFSRLGKKFITLRGTDYQEVVEICKANDIHDQEDINSIFNSYEGDLRRVDRHLLKIRMQQTKSRSRNA